ncbi:hypothetical protein MTO96_026574 [Rhipicephalus appendiculatus]
MTIEGAKPTECWIEMKCIVRCWSDTYKKAQEDLAVLQYESDGNAKRELGRGKRQRRPTILSDCADSEGSTGSTGDDDEYFPPKPPTPPRQTKAGKHNASLTKHQHQRRCYKEQIRIYNRGQSPQGPFSVATQHVLQSTRAQGGSAMVKCQLVCTDLCWKTREFVLPMSILVCKSMRRPWMPVHLSRPQMDSQILGEMPARLCTPLCEVQEVPPSNVNSGLQFCPSPKVPTHPERSQIDSMVLSFMEKNLCMLNTIKLTQQTHTQCFIELVKRVNDAPLKSDRHS